MRDSCQIARLIETHDKRLATCICFEYISSADKLSSSHSNYSTKNIRSSNFVKYKNERNFILEFSYSKIFESKKMNFLLLIFAILAASTSLVESFQWNSLEENNSDDRIVGGDTAHRGRFPYMVSLRIRRRLNSVGSWPHVCGGSILSNRWIVSAAQCTERQLLNISNVVIAVAAHRIHNDGQFYHLERIINHPKYNRTNLHSDISLLRTNRTIKFNFFVNPIPLRKQIVGDGIVSTVSGWGYFQVRMKFFRLSFLFTFCIRTINAMQYENAVSTTSAEERKFRFNFFFIINFCF